VQPSGDTGVSNPLTLITVSQWIKACEQISRLRDS
jgi:hypothetical protein